VVRALGDAWSRRGHLHYRGSLTHCMYTCLVVYAIILIMTIKIDPEKLRRARHRAGYSLRELGRVSNTDHNQLWMYENGRRNPQPRVIRRLAASLDVEVADLIEERR
jgi:predicted transcriptional regulator